VLAEEMARRLGKEKCWTVHWPAGCKDANDVLLRHGAEELHACIEAARPYPVRSLQDVLSYSDKVLDLYRQGRRRGLMTGFASVSELYTVPPGMLTVVTGLSGDGKSEWLDALMTNLAELHGWHFAVCSFENPPEEHIAKLVEKRLRKPFWDGPRPRMTESELHEAEAWVNDHFTLIRAEDEAPTLDWILENARIAVARYGVRGLVIDPYNEIEHKRPDGMTETEYVSQMLGKVKRFAANHGVHIWFVAHPAKMQRDRDRRLPVPTLYDISGSANWVNKADFGIVVHQLPKEEGSITEIHVRKVRFKWAGREGVAKLSYDRATGCYAEIQPQQKLAYVD
jgi:twinkle protein